MSQVIAEGRDRRQETARHRAAQTAVRTAADALPPDLAHLAEGPFAEALATAIDFAQRSVSPATEKIYGDDWTAFRVWCLEHGAPYLPAPPAIVAAYLAARSKTLGRSGLRLILAAIAFHHRRAGHLWVAGDPVIATVMRGILRAQKRPVRPAAALTSAEIRLLLGSCDDSLPGRAGLLAVRDRALLLTCFAGGLRRSELVALDREDLRFTADGLVLRIRHSKGDQEGEGADVRIARGARPATCPVRAMEGWLSRSGIAYGAVFRRITGGGRTEDRLTGNGVWKILRRRAALANLVVPDGERLSPHGMRAGFVTEAYLNGALDEQVMAHARQKDVTTTRRYRNRAKTVAASPTKLLDL
ncbi:MAG: tyrosine-type recombinase/integrase [Proteobacteria bacterium]|nr:tyrosine-type recombinase/integrase [Pseudomonadota bacterium]